MKHPILATLLALICLFTFVSCASSPSEPSVTDIVALKPGMPWPEGQEILGDAYRYVDSIIVVEDGLHYYHDTLNFPLSDGDLQIVLSKYCSPLSFITHGSPPVIHSAAINGTPLTVDEEGNFCLPDAWEPNTSERISSATHADIAQLSEATTPLQAESIFGTQYAGIRSEGFWVKELHYLLSDGSAVSLYFEHASMTDPSGKVMSGYYLQAVELDGEELTTDWKGYFRLP